MLGLVLVIVCGEMRRWLVAEVSGGGSRKEDGGVGVSDGKDKTGLEAGGVARLEWGRTEISSVASEAGVAGVGDCCTLICG